MPLPRIRGSAAARDPAGKAGLSAFLGALLLAGNLSAQETKALDPQKAVSTLAAAEAALAAGDAERALNLYTDAGVWDSRLWQVPYGIGRSYLVLGDPARAARAWETGAARFPQASILARSLADLRKSRPDLGIQDPGTEVPPSPSGPLPPGAPSRPPRAAPVRATRGPSRFRVEPWAGFRLGTLALGPFRSDREAALSRLARTGPDGEAVGSGTYDDPGSVLATTFRLSFSAPDGEKKRLALEVCPFYELSESFGWEERSAVYIPDINNQDREDLFRETLFKTDQLYFPLGSYRVEGVAEGKRRFSAAGFGLGPRYGLALGSLSLEMALPVEATWAQYRQEVSSSFSLPSVGGNGSFNSSTRLSAFALGLAPEAALNASLSKMRVRLSMGWRFLRFGPFRGTRKRFTSSNMSQEAFFDFADAALVMAPNADGGRELRVVPISALDPRGDLEEVRLNLGGFRVALELGLGFR